MKKTFLGIIALFMVLTLTACSSAADKQRIAELEAEISSMREAYNATENHVETSSDTSTTTTVAETRPDPFADYVTENHITLTRSDVQYNMTNNVDKYFTLIGDAELDDYYNYGFGSEIESEYFCLCVTPFGGSFSDRWYIYCHRDSFQQLFDKAKKGEIYVKMVCIIPKSRFKPNQQLMAELEYVVY